MQHDFLRFEDGAAIVVTGGASGIGAALAKAASEAGLRVSIWDLDADAAAEGAERLRANGGDTYSVGVDLTDRSAVVRAWQTTHDQLGAVGHLACVAGPPSFGQQSFDDGVLACLACMRNPTEVWLDGNATSEPSAVYFSSMQGTRYGAGVEWYTVGKGAVQSYAMSLAAMRPGSVRANSVLPDWTLTPRTAPHTNAITEDGVWGANPLLRMGSAEDCANAALFLLSPAAGYLNGISIEVDGGIRLRSTAWLTARGLS